MIKTYTEAARTVIEIIEEVSGGKVVLSLPSEPTGEDMMVNRHLLINIITFLHESLTTEDASDYVMEAMDWYKSLPDELKALVK